MHYLNKLFLIMVLCLAPVHACLAQSKSPLFVIERNTNSNRVYYEARIGSDSLFDARQPIHAYWIMWQKDPSGKTHEELNLVEKEKGFGFKAKLDPAKNSVWFTLVSLPSKPIKASIQNGAVVAQCVIGDHFSIVQKVSINVGEKNFLPFVKYIELFGTNPKTGEDAYERIVNR